MKMLSRAANLRPREETEDTRADWITWSAPFESRERDTIGSAEADPLRGST